MFMNFIVFINSILAFSEISSQLITLFSMACFNISSCVKLNTPSFFISNLKYELLVNYSMNGSVKAFPDIGFKSIPCFCVGYFE